MNPDARGEAVIDLGAYRRNLARLTEALHPATLMAVVKGDAYGHGLLEIAREARDAGVAHIGALDIETALALRADGLTDGATVFAWLHGPTDAYADAIDAGVELGISSVHELLALTRAGASRAARIHLKVDTGLHRNGASEAEWPLLVEAALVAERQGAVEIAGIWTHISEASDDEDTASISRFESAIATAGMRGVGGVTRHLAASAAGLARADSRFDLVRMGAFTYGISPGGGVSPAELGLEPVMTLQSHVSEVVEHDGIRLAFVPLGSGDGILGECAGRVSVAIGGERHQVTSVNLDVLTITAGPQVSLGDTVYLFGSGANAEPTLQEWADSIGTIGEEIVVRLSPKIPRRYTE